MHAITLVLSLLAAVPSPEQLTWTTRDLTLYVDATSGRDYVGCGQASGTSACKSLAMIQPQIPHGIRHVVTVSMTAGTYTGLWMEDYFIDRSASPSTGAGIVIAGTLSDPSPTSGVASGTAASATLASFTTGTKNTITKTSAGWTADNFKGMYLKFTSGALSGKMYPIVTNTATVLTVGGSFSDDGGSPSGATFVIKDLGTKFTSSGMATGPLGQYGFASFDGYYVWFLRNIGPSAMDALRFSNVEFNTTGGAQIDVYVADSAVTFDHCRMKNTTDNYLVAVGPHNTLASYETIYLLHSDFNFGFFTISEAFSGASNGSAASSLVSVGDVAYSDQTKKGYWLVGTGLHAEVFYHYSTNINRAIWVGQSAVIVYSGIFATQVACVTASYGTGVTGDSTVAIVSAYFDTCSSVAVNGDGRVTISFTGTSGGASNGVGVQSNNTATIVIVAATNIGATNETNVDGTVTTLAALRAASPTAVIGPKTGARIYQ